MFDQKKKRSSFLRELKDRSQFGADGRIGDEEVQNSKCR